jgi:hypothetical protein
MSVATETRKPRRGGRRPAAQQPDATAEPVQPEPVAAAETPVQPEQTPEPETPASQPEQPEAFARVHADARPVTYWWGRIEAVAPDGTVETVQCEHQMYGHSREDLALNCAKALAASRGLKVR